MEANNKSLEKSLVEGYGGIWNKYQANKEEGFMQANNYNFNFGTKSLLDFSEIEYTTREGQKFVVKQEGTPMQANNAYDENGMPLNLQVRASGTKNSFFQVWFTDLPKCKYFSNGVTWNFLVNKDRIEKELGRVVIMMPSRKITFSDLPKHVQETVLHYYKDTFGLPGEPVLS